VLRIRIVFKSDLDPDPAFFVNADPDPDPGFGDQKLEKIYSRILFINFFFFF
jgi:hypothetical protein